MQESKRKQTVKENEKKINVLVTGVGAIIGYGVIKSLRQTGLPVHIVGMDIYADAVGQYFCDKFIRAIYAVDPQYISFLRGVIQENSIDLVFFGTEQELYRVNATREEMGEDLKKIVINRPEILALSQDKWETYCYLLDHGMEDLAIPSVLSGSYEELTQRFGTEFLLKPRSSYASKGIHRVSDREAFDFYGGRMGSNFMAQPLVGDPMHEYTVGAFGLGDGKISGMIAMRRQLSQEGATAKAEVVTDPELTRAVDRLCQSLKPVGPTNFQFRLHEGRYLLLEINPRISSSTSIRAAFGYNEAWMSLEYWLYHRVITPDIRGGRALRFIDEVVALQ